ncbi:MAG: hypothetical protein K2L69_07695 [Muribaculaceae bacterium]|nr:hypothetical protein [Muribaculaceae bacterium]MDE6610898.1 hypothetical protein [Muribaculaceae bacterium]
MFRKLQNRLALLCGISALALTGCASEDGPAPVSEPVMVSIETRVPRSVTEKDDTLHSDLNITNGIILIYDENGTYEAGDKLVINGNGDREGKTSLVVSPGKKHIICVANPPKAFRDLIATDTDKPTPILDEFGNAKTYRGDTIWVNITPVHKQYEDLVKTLSLTKDYVKSVTSTHRMLMVKDQESEIVGDQFLNAYVTVPLTVPMARVDLHARCMSEEKARVADAAIRVEHVSPYLNWDLTHPAEEDSIISPWRGISDKMTLVSSRDEIFGDWSNTEVQEDAPIATLYTYNTDSNVRIWVGLRFEGGADFEWYPIDMAELMLPSSFKGLLSGHLYQIFISVYPDRIGKIIVDPWLPSDLSFTIG